MSYLYEHFSKFIVTIIGAVGVIIGAIIIYLNLDSILSFFTKGFLG